MESARCPRSGYDELSLAAKVEVRAAFKGFPVAVGRWHGVGSCFSSSSLIARSPSELALLEHWGCRTL